MGTEDRNIIQVTVVDDDEILLHGVRGWLTQEANPYDAESGPSVRVAATAKSVTELLSRIGRPEPPRNQFAVNGYGPRATNGAHLRNNGVHRPRYPQPAPEAEYKFAPVALLDLRLRDGRTIAENVQALIHAGYAVVTCSTIDDAGLVHEAGRAGALSYVRKSGDATDMRLALVAAAKGERYVSQSHAALIQRARSYGVPELSGQEREALRLYASGLTMSSVARRLNVKQGTAKSYLDRVRDKYEQAGRAARTKLELRDRAMEDGVLNSPRLD